MGLDRDPRRERDLPDGRWRVPAHRRVRRPAHHPSSFAGRANLDDDADLVLYRIGVDTTTGLTPEELDASVGRITIANGTAERERRLDDVRSRRAESHRPFRPERAVPLEFQRNRDHQPVRRGTRFKIDTSRTYRWGNNTISSPNSVTNVRSGNQMLIDFDNGNDTIGFVTRFDRGITNAGNPISDGSLPDEAQGTFGDSGGPVFWKDEGEWVLAGLMHAIYQDSTQGNSIQLQQTAWFGNHTAISDLSLPHYRDQIEDIRSTVMYSYAGDIDLDGSATGEIVGSVATGDLAVLVDNWLATFPSAGRESWIAGDLNQDAIVDLSDFVLLRDALGGEIETTALAALIRGVAVPEPTGALILLGLMAATTARPRR